MWNAALPVLQNNLSKKLERLLASYAKIRNVSAELSQQLTEKSRALTEAQHKANDYVEKSLAAQEEQHQIAETRHKTELEALQRTFEKRCSILEERYREAAEVYQAAEHNQSNLDARYKEALVRLARQTDEIEMLFYAIGLLVRTLHAMRTRQSELISQKKLLQNMVKDSQHLRDGISLLAQALTGQFEDFSVPFVMPKKHASFKGLPHLILLSLM